MRALGLRYLGRRDHSRLELARKLAAKGFPGALVDQVLDGFEAQGWLDDRRFAQGLIRRRMEQGYGVERIRQELRSLGIAEWEGAAVAGEWDSVIRKAYLKRFGDAPAKSPRELAERRRFLLRRGFQAEQIHTLLRHSEFLEDAFD